VTQVTWIKGWPVEPGDYWLFAAWPRERKVSRLRVFANSCLTMVAEVGNGWDFLYKTEVKGETWFALRDEPVPDPPEE